MSSTAPSRRPSPFRRHSLVVSALAVAGAAVVGLSGCSAPGGDSASGGSSGGASTSPSVTSKPTISVSPPAPSPDPQDPDAPGRQCPDEALKVAVTEDPGGSGAGSTGYDIVFTNTGGGSCELRGYPGVSVVGHGDGTQLGVPAERPSAGPAIQTVSIQPGGAATAVVRVANLQGGGGATGCATATGDGWRVYPPHSFAAVFVPDAGVLACTDSTVWMDFASPVAND
ncbi:DUF4232 domain-containing protein [Schumannella soli]|uniref:DUF4232 domain-containing protein n=1 Tax=Schumannella soli TaxID=2590779 RepID=A0A506Y876_9MICO|nr:DUF4232 domain-containing protein [Schumannella soli]TPW77268.1 DUF4232 domain-containing protein [Schumannella soli]